MMDFVVNSKTFKVEERDRKENHVRVNVDGSDFQVEKIQLSGPDSSIMLARVGSRLFLCKHELDGRIVHLLVNDKPLKVELVMTRAVERAVSIQSDGPVSVDAPMAGRIIEILTSPGKTTEAGQPLIVLEAMKMENEILAPKRGTVREVHVKVGSLVRPGEPLVTVD